jgi:hypothetical protein
MMFASVLANAVLVLHILYVSFVIFGVVLVVIGGLCRWRWVHNPWFRLTHLLMILIVVAESFLDMTCPLTTWERALRPGSMNYEDKDLIATWLDGLLFYHFPHWVFTVAYTAFGLLIIGLFFFVPIRRSSSK